VSEIVANNYAPLNKAVNLELDKYEAHNRLRYSKVFLNVCGGIGVLVLLLSVAWYLFTAAATSPGTGSGNSSIETSAVRLEDTTRSTPEENQSIRKELQDLETRDEDLLIVKKVDVLLPPERQYTVFTNVATETGETVVTGRVFEAGEWGKPSHQYCYLDLPGLVGGTPIVDLDSAGELILHSTDDVLVNFARKYCRFE